MTTIKDLINFGVINIDKPSGPTSFSISEFIKRQLKLSKTSHMGTLDPKVTGVLPITLGRACRLASYLISKEKAYTGILHAHKPQKIEELQKIIDEKFIGEIKQIPPHKSAVKREERKRKVYKFKLLEATDDGKNFLFDCIVEGGTYIRKICSDLGEIIGGAHMGELKRTRAGIFDESKIYNMFEFEKAAGEFKNEDEKKLREIIVPAEEVIKKILPFFEVKEEALKSLYTGKPILAKDIIGTSKLIPGDFFAIFHGDVFIGIYKKTDEEIIFGRAQFIKDIK
ncbi:MAG: RNA-guided pseudouridylation complex pseudouridine synthase subunit Cbf5 [Candidatus Pacearchaeota archaeon]